MKINIVGGGPAALYFAILMKKQNPAHTITLYERDGPNDTYGWGIVFSQRTMDNLRENDPPSYEAIVRIAQSWDVTGVAYRDHLFWIRGNRTFGLPRLGFLQVLRRRALELGVDLRFNTNVTEPAQLEKLRDADLLIGADGANSVVRRTYQDYFMPILDLRQNKYLWLGTRQSFAGLTMGFRETPQGYYIFHAYQFSPNTSTFIVECPPETWHAAGFAKMGDAETCRYLENIFAYDLGGHELLSNNFVRWLNFTLVKDKRWHFENVLLLGDATHTAHFSIGSGTKLALEDSIALARAFAERDRLQDVVELYVLRRKPIVDDLQAAAVNSLSWLENIRQHMHLEPVPFAYAVATRSNRVGYNRLKRQAPDFAAQYDEWRKSQAAYTGKIPREFLDLFQKRTFGHLATMMPDGTPQVTSVYVDYDGEYLIINSAKGRQKDRNMERNPNVAVEITDPDNPNRYLQIRGRVVAIMEDGADEHIDKLAQRYLAREKYPPTWRFAGEVRRLYKISLDHVTAWEPFG